MHFLKIEVVFHIKKIRSSSIYKTKLGHLTLTKKLRLSYIKKRIKVVFHLQNIQVIFHLQKKEVIFHLLEKIDVFFQFGSYNNPSLLIKSELSLVHISIFQINWKIPS